MTFRHSHRMRGASALAVAILLAAPTASLAHAEEFKGIVIARDGADMIVATETGGETKVTLTDATKVESISGVFGLQRDDLLVTDLINGLPVTVEAQTSGQALEAVHVTFKASDLNTARQVEAGTRQVKQQAREKVGELEAKNAELRQRMAEANQYVEKGEATLLFTVGSAAISSQGKQDLEALATQAMTVKGYLIGVVGHADPTGDAQSNQVLSERRAEAVITYLQKYCGVKPYRVLSPDAMGEAHIVGDTSTPMGLAQNRRVEVKILANKGLEGL